MAIPCLYCQHRMRLKGAHPGRFQPTCDRCHEKFLLIIPSEPEAAPMVLPLEPSRRAQASPRKNGFK
jgi:hypothetical protein